MWRCNKQECHDFPELINETILINETMEFFEIVNNRDNGFFEIVNYQDNGNNNRDIVSIPGPHEGRGQNTNPECQLESRVSTGITSGDESAQRATSDASWYEGFELIRGACIAPVPNKGSRYRHYYFCKPILLRSKISHQKSPYWYSKCLFEGEMENDHQID